MVGEAWSLEDDRKLLLNLVDLMNPAAKDMNIEALASIFEGRTPRSIKEHIAKLRKEAKQVAAPATLPDGFQLPPPQARAPRTTKEKPNGAAKGNGNGQGTKPGRGGGGGRSGKRKHSETITEANGEVDGVDDEEAESGGKRFKVEVTEDDGANDELEAA